MIGPHECGPSRPLLVIAGPCVIDDESLCLRIADELAALSAALPINVVFKASFDKANRTSVSSYRGLGLDEGLAVLERV
ncbi:MAG: 3-deoxy-8-phosphooctulonate synthase, partial [Planctomycetia bacterium]